MTFSVHLSAFEFGQRPEGPYEYPNLKLIFTHASLAEDANFYDVLNSKYDNRHIFNTEMFKFPSPKTVEQREINLPNTVSEVALWAALETPWNKSVSQGFYVSPLGVDDKLVLAGITPRMFTGNIIHSTKKFKAERCVVRCADGRSSQTCITCRDENVTVKICC